MDWKLGSNPIRKVTAVIKRSAIGSPGEHAIDVTNGNAISNSVKILAKFRCVTRIAIPIKLASPTEKFARFDDRVRFAARNFRFHSGTDSVIPFGTQKRTKLLFE